MESIYGSNTRPLEVILVVIKTTIYITKSSNQSEKSC